MQLIIKHNVNNLELPINYQHLIQSIIYKNIRNDYDYSSFMHDIGHGEEQKRRFKLFTFGKLRGRYEISNKKIIFRDNVSFEVRSPDITLIETLYRNLEVNGIVYAGQHYGDLKLLRNDITVEADKVIIRMNSPLTVYSTDRDDNSQRKKTLFYDPYDGMFGAMINGNFKRKYKACFGVEPVSDVKTEPVDISVKDKTVTSYKGFFIDAWGGIYELSGERKYLDFLYQTGLGSKNAQGFGMFDIIG